MRNLGTLLVVAITLAACATEDDVDFGDAVGASQVLQPEVEPNATAANATPIVGTSAVLIGNNLPGSDADFYSFSGAAGDRVYVTTMTAIAQGSTDSTVTLFRADGTTVVETDVSDGTFAGSAGAIAGATLPATETYFVRVTQASTSTIRPYHLHFQLRTGVPESEAAEPNDAVPQPLVSGWVAGSLASATDVDLYTVVLNAGDTIYASLDLDPERDAVEFNGFVGIGPFGATPTILTVNDAGAAGPDAEAHFVTAKNAGVYTIAVGATGALFSTYHLNVTVHPAASTAGCTTYTSTDVPQTVPPVGAAVSTLVIPDDVRVADLDVHVQMTHDWVNDVTIHLVPPDGNRIGVELAAGPSGLGVMDVTLDDEAGIPITAYTIVSGMKSLPSPSFRLHWADGQRAQGTWTLRVEDRFDPDGGTLTSWGVTICPVEPPPACPGGTTPEVMFSTDFETDDAGFTHSGAQDEWERGLPSFAPITTCNSGVNCWKTDLDNTYNSSAAADLVSPPIALPGNFVGPIRLEWAQKYQFENATFDRGIVEVRRVDDSNPTRFFEFKDATMTDTIAGSVVVPLSAGWGVHSADITSYAGAPVELRFRLESDSSINHGGFAIDDVVVTGCRLPSVCGNGIPEAGELCDDGNTDNGDGCSADCQSDETCGNGYTDSGLPTDPEVCDDGNTDDEDGCSANCLSTEVCGNNIIDTSVGEVCDVGDTVGGDGCSADCLSDESCGNDYTDTDAGEQCDDGGTTGDDGCSADCLSDETCGNDVLDDTITPTPELCDDGNTNNGDGCSASCLSNETCGNGITDSPVGEVCDDSNTAPSDGCSADCRSDETCGNGVTDTTEGEQCDDGNTAPLDGCSADCLSNESCGNGVTDPGEQCDDGNTTGGDGCTAACDDEVCGNGIQDPGEECDDGNTTSGDGCNGTCTIDEGCGNGTVDQDELCDDGNTADGDGCSADCDSDESCGNGIEELDEACDDGNTTDGDGCESDCTYPEAAARCGDGNVDAVEECDDGNRVNGDGCSSDCITEVEGERGCACNGGEGGASNLLVLGLAGLAIFGTRRRPSTRRRKRLAQDERA